MASSSNRSETGRNVTSTLEVLDLATGKRNSLATFDYLIEAPNWLQSGEQLLYNSQGHLYRFDIATATSERIESGYAIRCNNDHVLSPDNSELAVSHHTQEDGLSRIYTFPLSGGTPRLITPLAPSYLHGWSPDGRTLAYCAERNGQYDIYTIPALGGVETRLTTTPGLDDGPEFSPDGEWIWFNSMRSGLMQVWRMRADGSQQTQMTHDEHNNWFPHVSPDGQWVVYLSYRKEDVLPGEHPPNKDVVLRLLSSAGGEARTLVELFGGQGTINVNSWAPDSQRLAFVSYAVSQ